ncbi:MAG: aldo/keto reductase [Ilumatobacteraceae bacterium]
MAPRRLGSSGLAVAPIALGTMMFGAWGQPDPAACRRMVHRALDAGITLFDTADIYDFGRSEEILGDALRGRRDRVVLATKCGNPMDGDPLHRGLSARWIRSSCEASLRRLGVEHIDLYQMHRPDPSVPLAETLGAFDDLVSAGKIGAVGTSTFPAPLLDELQSVAAASGLAAPTVEQPPYSILARGIETSVLPACRRHDLGVLVWAPLNGGWLTGKYQQTSASDDETSRANRQGEHFDHRDSAVRRRKLALVDRLSVVATDCGLTLVQLALAFVLDDPAVSAAVDRPADAPAARRPARRRRAGAAVGRSFGDRRDRRPRRERQPRRRDLTRDVVLRSPGS